MADFLTLYSPATVANMVCGFDVLGFALEAPYDTMHMRLTDEPGVQIVHEDDFHLPTEPARNVAGAALLALLKAAPAGTGFEVRINKAILPGSGIGSSAASAAGAVVGANKLLGGFFSPEELVRFAMFGEEVASGAQHADNIAPAIYGGVTLIRSTDPLDIVPLSAPPLHATVVHPQIEIRTADARQILKQEVPLKSAIRQWANVGGLVAGLLQADYQLIGRSLEDVVVEPVRSILIPGFAAVKSCSLEAGALGGGISGSGPSIFMLSETEATAQAVATAMRTVYEKLGVDFRIHVSTINPVGVRFKH
ncbi:homoserine kinase [Hymenobacter qilianensis]|uniref:Homoserine kinase n=2 Tax=Hymenobacter qilianensis TaxID=1385715 RepID=A0ACB5PP79_9BACT|nr:homoserine kinase [Hymenobacter qilianensis]QNP53273.1 homoserine kinase [Hymenobacter qilianensis]GGF58135.1 homoserine kinase [Hymenobacter qilianensis]